MCESVLLPYHAECTGSRLITEVKQPWAGLVLGWVATWEHPVLYYFFHPMNGLCESVGVSYSHTMLNVLIPI